MPYKCIADGFVDFIFFYFNVIALWRPFENMRICFLDILGEIEAKDLFMGLVPFWQEKWIYWIENNQLLEDE